MNIKQDHQQISLKNTLARFLDFELDCNSGQLKSLIKPDKSSHLEPLLFQFLLVLISKQGEIVSKQEVLESLWPGKTPSDAALRSMVKKTREALDDDAKNPDYIKTIPNKGYMLIPAVKLSSSVSRPWFQRPHYLVPIIASFLLFLFSVFWFYNMDEQAQIEPEKGLSFELALLTESKDLEVSTYFKKDTQSFISLQYENISQQSSLLFEDLHLKRQFRVSYENQILDQYIWSDIEHAVLLTRSDGLGFYITQLLSNEQAPTTQFCPKPLADDVIALGFRSSIGGSNTAIVFVRKVSNGKVFIIDCDNKNETATIEETLKALNGLNKAVMELSVDNDNSYTVSALWLSPNNTTMLALVNPLSNENNGSNDSYLIAFDLTSLDRIETPPLRLTGLVKTGVWNDIGDRFSYSNDKNQVFSYQLPQNKVVSWFTGNQAVGKILSDCGSNCFVVSNKKAISQSIFINNPILESANIVQTTIKNLDSVPERLVTAKNNGYYFVSPINNKTTIRFREWSGKETTIHTFESIVSLNEFKINHLETLMVGLMNYRPFVLDLKSLNLAYLSLNVERIQDIRFVDEQTIGYYSLNTDGSSGLYRLDLISKQLTLVKENAKFNATLSFTTNVETNDKVSAELIVDPSQNGSVMFSDNREPIEVGSLAGECISCWQLRGNKLYQFANQKLRVTELPSMTSTEVDMRLNAVVSEFDVSPNEQYLVFVLPQNDHEEIKKISKLQAIF